MMIWLLIIWWHFDGGLSCRFCWILLMAESDKSSEVIEDDWSRRWMTWTTPFDSIESIDPAGAAGIHQSNREVLMDRLWSLKFPWRSRHISIRTKWRVVEDWSFCHWLEPLVLKWCPLWALWCHPLSSFFPSSSSLLPSMWIHPAISDSMAVSKWNRAKRKSDAKHPRLDPAGKWRWISKSRKRWWNSGRRMAGVIEVVTSIKQGDVYGDGNGLIRDCHYFLLPEAGRKQAGCPLPETATKMVWKSIRAFNAR